MGYDRWTVFPIYGSVVTCYCLLNDLPSVPSRSIELNADYSLPDSCSKRRLVRVCRCCILSAISRRIVLSYQCIVPNCPKVARCGVHYWACVHALGYIEHGIDGSRLRCVTRYLSTE